MKVAANSPFGADHGQARKYRGLDLAPSRLRKKGCRDIDSVQAPRFYDLGKDFGCLAGGSQIVFRAVGYTATSTYVA